jgi:hypothetical protein
MITEIKLKYLIKGGLDSKIKLKYSFKLYIRYAHIARHSHLHEISRNTVGVVETAPNIIAY